MHQKLSQKELQSLEKEQDGDKICLVEDNDLNMEIAKFHLEQEKAKVFTAVNGQEAVEMFERSGAWTALTQKQFQLSQ